MMKLMQLKLHRLALLLTLLGVPGVSAGDIDMKAMIRELTGRHSPVTLHIDAPADAAAALACSGEAAVDPLIGVLADPRPDVRRLAAWALGEVGDERASGPLAVLLEDDNGLVLNTAAASLQRIGAVTELSVALRSDKAVTRNAAARALGGIGDSKAAQELSALLEDGDVAVRRASAEALGHIGEPKVAGALILLLDDDDHVVRHHAVWALKAILPPDELSEHFDDSARFLVERMSAADDEKRSAATRVLTLLGEPATGLAIRGLFSDDACVRRHAAEALWRMRTRDRRAIEPLVDVLRSTDTVARAYAAGALGAAGDTRAVAPLIETLDDDDAMVREMAIGALGLLADDRAVPGLSAFLENETPEIRLAAAAALGGLGAPALPSLVSALRDDDYAVRKAAAESLGHIANPCAVQPLLEAYTALLEDPDYDHVRASVRQPLREVYWAIVDAFSRMRGDRNAIEALVAMLDATPLRAHAALNRLNRALEEATGHRVFYGRTYGGAGAATIVEGWKDWLKETGSKSI